VRQRGEILSPRGRAWSRQLCCRSDRFDVDLEDLGEREDRDALTVRLVERHQIGGTLCLAGSDLGLDLAAKTHEVLDDELMASFSESSHAASSRLHIARYSSYENELR